MVALATTTPGAGTTRPLCPLAAPPPTHMKCGCSTKPHPVIDSKRRVGHCPTCLFTLSSSSFASVCLPANAADLLTTLSSNEDFDARKYRYLPV